MGFNEGVRKIDLRLLVHLLIGGLLCSVALFFLKNLIIIDLLLKSLNCLGALIFEEAQIGKKIISFGLIHLPSGFLGGLYTGYKIKERLKINLVFPSIIALLISAIYTTVILFISGYTGSLQFFPILLGYYFGLSADYLMGIIAPFLVMTTGVYLGGYTVSWKVEERIEEEIRFLKE
ncbi:hypothetical protein KEJ29_00810 [Candidatus Bathyarchaeota archaeon]|nr:hypothetical protein [Candidatus Bathyarchaeota archaeon]